MRTFLSIVVEMEQAQRRLFEEEQMMASGNRSGAVIASQIANRGLLALLRSDFERIAKALRRPLSRYTIEAGRPAAMLDAGGIGSMLTGYRHLYGLCRTAITTNQQIDTFDKQTPFSLNWGYVESNGGLTFGLLESQDQFELALGDQKEPEELVSETVATVAGMVKCSRPRDLEPWIAKVGRGPIKALTAWAEAHGDNRCGVDSEWLGTKTPSSLIRSAAQVNDLWTVLTTNTRAEKREIIEVEGTFLGGYADTRRFRFQAFDGKVYHGKMSRELNNRPKEYPASYVATIGVTKGERAATGELFEEYTLQDLDQK